MQLLHACAGAGEGGIMYTSEDSATTVVLKRCSVTTNSAATKSKNGDLGHRHLDVLCMWKENTKIETSTQPCMHTLKERKGKP